MLPEGATHIEYDSNAFTFTWRVDHFSVWLNPNDTMESTLRDAFSAVWEAGTRAFSAAIVAGGKATLTPDMDARHVKNFLHCASTVRA